MNYDRDRRLQGLSSLDPVNAGQTFRIMRLKRDEVGSNQHRALAPCLRMISAQASCACREGKPQHTFPDHALAA